MTWKISTFHIFLGQKEHRSRQRGTSGHPRHWQDRDRFTFIDLFASLVRLAALDSRYCIGRPLTASVRLCKRSTHPSLLSHETSSVLLELLLLLLSNPRASSRSSVWSSSNKRGFRFLPNSAEEYTHDKNTSLVCLHHWKKKLKIEYRWSLTCFSSYQRRRRRSRLVSSRTRLGLF